MHPPQKRFSLERSHWARDGLTDPRVKVLAGLRGADVSGHLLSVRDGLREHGVDESRLVVIDFEDARFRRLKTADNVMEYLGGLAESAAPRYLFLISCCRIMHHTDLLRTLQGQGGKWNVWVAAYTAHVVGDGDPFRQYPWMTVRRVWTDPDLVRTPAESKLVWCEVFQDAIARSVRSPDVRALDYIAEHLSRHLGEQTTLREIAAALQGFGYGVSANSVRFYRGVLEQCYLVDASYAYDVFERRVLPKLGVRMFWTDLGLRAWRFGPADEFETERVALARLYLKLRRAHSRVYTPVGHDADFVTIEPSGELRYWSVSEDEAPGIREFRASLG